MRLTDLEAVFRSLESELGLRLIYHWKPRRADAHLFVTALAYQLVQVIRTRLQPHGERSSWQTLRERLAGQPVTAQLRRQDGRMLHVRKATHAEPSQLAIYDKLRRGCLAGRGAQTGRVAGVVARTYLT